ncbi:interleukin-2 receptor subunit beta [Nannospalax galili]|uniref:Interleukin-2 receptor subunit beta n=1 Tax=Nannospalax galili TaxID=1026970 RepID=A0A8C6RHY8_NANGA|nr:interleukin-2 receptor subunit beta [Nannospalax galili]
MAATALSWSLSLLLILLSLATSRVCATEKDKSHLKCFYNSRANVSCVWSSEEAVEATTCHIHAQSDSRPWNKTCKLRPVRRASWACDLILGSLDSQSLTSADFVNMSVVCWEGGRWHMVKTQGFRPFENLRLMAPHSLKVLLVETQTCNISWQVSQVSHYIIQDLEFEVRTQSPGRSWEDMPLLSLKQWQQWICLEKLTPDTLYEMQVRVRAQRGDHRTWSPWSQPLAFQTRPADPRKEILPISWVRHLLLSLGCIFGFLVCVGVLTKCQYLGPWLKTVLKCHVPDPSEFFSQLSSQHGGDLQKWLSSPVPSSSFSPTGPMPEISPLEVLDQDTKATQLLLLQQDKVPSPSPGGQSQASCFTNQGYFFFHLPDALEIEACQVYFTYDPCAEDEEDNGSELPSGSPLPSLPPLAGEDDAYCTFPPGEDLLLFSPMLLGSQSTTSAALGGRSAPEERPALSPQEGPPALADPDLVGLQCPLELALQRGQEGVLNHSTGEGAIVPEASLCQQGQDRALTSGLALNTDAYLSLQELQAQDPAYLV